MTSRMVEEGTLKNLSSIKGMKTLAKKCQKQVFQNFGN